MESKNIIIIFIICTITQMYGAESENLNKKIDLKSIGIDKVQYLDLNETEPIDLEDFKDYVIRHEPLKRPFILARVVTNSEDHPSYYSAGTFNKHIFNNYPIYPNIDPANPSLQKWKIGVNENNIKEIYHRISRTAAGHNAAYDKWELVTDLVNQNPLKPDSINYFKINSLHDDEFEYLCNFNDLIQENTKGNNLRKYFYDNDPEYIEKNTEAIKKELAGAEKKFNNQFELGSMAFINEDFSKALDYLIPITKQDADINLKHEALYMVARIYFNLADYKNAKLYINLGLKNNSTENKRQLKELHNKIAEYEIEHLIKHLPKNKNLKLFKEPNDPLEYSYEGIIERYNQNIGNPIGKKILSNLNEIAYTKYQFAERFPFIKQYLFKNSLSQKEISEKLGA
ncbi:MAG: hypothetical protein P4L22_05455 [Candidatus Babeliales bacterium]|nr:hypothetical protein [Candidatus Babeliales bacterium]